MEINIEIQTDMKIPKILIGKMVLFQFKNTGLNTMLNAIIFITDISDAIYGSFVALDCPTFPMLYRLPVISEPIECYKRVPIKELPLYVDYQFKFNLYDKFLKGEV